MKKTQKLKKLELKTQKIRTLTPEQLNQAAGGWWAPEESKWITCSCNGGCGAQTVDCCP